MRGLLGQHGQHGAEAGHAVLPGRSTRSRWERQRFALYGREYAVAIQPRESGLVMYTLRRKKEVRAMSAIDELGQVPTEVNDAEVALARQVIGNFEGEIDLGDTVDQYQAELRSVIDAKIAGEEFVVKEEEAPTKAKRKQA